jgi:hypothetical protein
LCCIYAVAQPQHTSHFLADAGREISAIAIQAGDEYNAESNNSACAVHLPAGLKEVLHTYSQFRDSISGPFAEDMQYIPRLSRQSLESRDGKAFDIHVSIS